MTVTAAAPRTHGLHAPLLATSVSALGAGASTAYLASRIAGPQLGHLNIGIIAAMTAGIAGGSVVAGSYGGFGAATALSGVGIASGAIAGALIGGGRAPGRMALAGIAAGALLVALPAFVGAALNQH
ncbi:MAG: hypothetical protein H7287_07765 [Thermoleophilia bacterium]|nr:hypothetical protein [Thermoleophilia bacterium]